MSERASEMVERVAKAIYASGQFVKPWDKCSWQHACRRQARTAITAMRQDVAPLLMNIISISRFEQEHPIGMHMTALSLIEKGANSALVAISETPASGVPAHAKSHPESGGAG